MEARSSTIEHPLLDEVCSSEHFLHLTLFTYPELNVVFLRFLKLPVLLQLRLVNAEVGFQVEEFVSSEVVEYIQQGKKFCLPDYIEPIAVVFRYLRFTQTSETFRRRVVQYLITNRDSDDSKTRRQVAEMWVNLGNTLPNNRHRTRAGRDDLFMKNTPPFYEIDGEKCDMPGCYVKGALADRTLARAWHNLGWYLTKKEDTIVVGDETLNRRQCLERCVEAEPDYSVGWNQLGFVVSYDGDHAVVNGRQYSQFQCFLKGVEVGVGVGLNWYNLGTTLGVGSNPHSLSIGGKTYTSRGCYVKAIELDNRFDAWTALCQNLQEEELVEIKGKQYNAVQCGVTGVETAIREEESPEISWYYLARTMERREEDIKTRTVDVNGTPFTACQAYAKCWLHGKRFGVFECERLMPDDKRVCVEGTWFRVHNRSLEAVPEVDTADVTESDSEG